MRNSVKRVTALLQLRSLLSKEKPAQRGAAEGRAGGFGRSVSRVWPCSTPGFLPPVPSPSRSSAWGSQRPQARPMWHFLGTSKVSLRPSRPFQPAQSTRAVPPAAPPPCPGMAAPWHHLGPMPSPGPHGVVRSPWHHRVPVVLRGPHGTTGGLWHREGPVGSLWHRMLLDPWLFG